MSIRKYRVALDIGNTSFCVSTDIKESMRSIALEMKKILDIIPEVECMIFDYPEMKDGLTEIYRVVSEVNKSNCDLLISLHADSCEDPSVCGYQIYNFKHKGESKRLSECIHKETVTNMDVTDRGIKDGSKYVELRQTTMPAVLIKHGFSSNHNDMQRMLHEAHNFAKVNVLGILSYLGFDHLQDVFETPHGKLLLSV